MQWLPQGDPEVDARKLALARRAVALHPHSRQCWALLLSALRQAGEVAELRRSAGEAATRCPDDADLLLYRAWALMQTGELEAALAALERAPPAARDQTATRRLRARLLMLLRRPGAAATFADDPAQDASSFPEAAARALSNAGRSDALLALADAHLARCPGDTGATYWKAMGLARAGRAAEARALLSLDRFVDVTTLPAPEGFADADVFRAALAREIMSSPTLTVDPVGKATRHGRQTLRLRRPDAPAIEALLGHVKTAVAAYAARLPNGPDGFVRARPDCASLAAWAVVTGADGHQDLHHHRSGWLSGVYYVTAPRGGDRFLGPLVLGGSDAGEAPWGTREIEPVPGRLVLFPSYVPHATRPSAADGVRIVVAFDVVPATAAAATCP